MRDIFFEGKMKKVFVFLLLAALLCGCAGQANQKNSDQVASLATAKPASGNRGPTTHEPMQSDPSRPAGMVYSSGPTPVPVTAGASVGPAATPNATARPNAPTPAPTELPNPLILDLTSGKNADCFAGLKGETLTVSVQSQIEAATYVFEGVYLGKVLEKFGITTYKKIEAVANDAMGTVDITAHMKDGDVMLAWRESKNGSVFFAETPIRLCPKNATLSQQLIKQIMRIVITR